MKVKKPVLVVVFLIAVAVIAAIWALAPAADAGQPQLAGAQNAGQPEPFDGERAYADVLYQTDLGPRTLGSEAHAQTVDWIAASLQAAGWEAEVQETAFRGQVLKNVIGRRTFATGESGGGPWIILGAHYDSRFFADRDPEPARREEPVPGGNDGASGVAVLLELARTLPALAADQGMAQGEVWLVFFDAEDNGSIAGYDWIMGSRAFVQSLEGQPDAAVIVDMIGDADLNIYYERSSSPELAEAIWEHAAELGYADVFIPEYKYNILDDHRPFLERGIPAVDIIDFDYPYWHTTADTADKVSSGSLKMVGDTVLSWLLEQLKN